MVSSIYELYGEVWGEPDTELASDIRKSLNPRTPSVLFDMFESLGPRPDATVLDVGCRDALYSIELARRFNCNVTAIDPVPFHIEKASRHITKTGTGQRVRAEVANVEALPFADGSFEHVWCRDVLIHVDLMHGLAECSRVLRVGGTMLTYQPFATELCEPEEARRLFKALAILPENMSVEYFEATARKAGFEIVKRDVIDSEWAEAKIEVGDKWLLDELLFVARMLRSKAALVRKYGEASYEANYASLLYEVYPMLGKLCPTVHTLKRAA